MERVDRANVEVESDVKETAIEVDLYDLVYSEKGGAFDSRCLQESLRYPALEMEKRNLRIIKLYLSSTD